MNEKTMYEGNIVDPTFSKEFEGRKKYTSNYITVAVLSGSWQQMGRQDGSFLGDNIRAVCNLVALYRDKCNKTCGKVHAGVIEDFYQSYLPCFKEFFQGISETSGLTLEQLKVANSLEFVLMYGPEIYNSRCSAVCIYASTAINQRGIYVAENDCSMHDKQSAGVYVTGHHLTLNNWVKDDVMLLPLMAQTNHYFVIPEGWGLRTFVEEDSSGSIIPGGSIPRLTNLLAAASMIIFLYFG